MITIDAINLSISSLISNPTCKSRVSFSLSLHTLAKKPCSFLCKSQLSLSTTPSSIVFESQSNSNLPLSISPHFFAAPSVYDLLVNKHHFSPQIASLVASDLTRSRSPEKADSILTFLEEIGFSSAQLEKFVKCKPRILTAQFEDGIRSKIKIFQELGFSPDDIAQITSNNQVILQVTVKNRIVPSLTLLKGLLGSESHHDDIARLLKKCAWFVTADLEKNLLPNVEILKSFGVSMADIRRVLFSYPRFLLVKPEIMMKSVEKAKEMGATESSRMFVYGVRVFASMSDEALERKLRAFGDMGFSEEDVVAMFGKAPQVFMVSMEKIKKVKELLVSTGKFEDGSRSIVDHPCLVGCSIEKRLKPRLRILGVLESENLMKKWPSIGRIYTMSDDKFLDRFVWPYYKRVGKAFETMSYLKGREG